MPHLVIHTADGQGLHKQLQHGVGCDRGGAGGPTGTLQGHKGSLQCLCADLKVSCHSRLGQRSSQGSCVRSRGCKACCNAGCLAGCDHNSGSNPCRLQGTARAGRPSSWCCQQACCCCPVQPEQCRVWQARCGGLQLSTRCLQLVPCASTQAHVGRRHVLQGSQKMPTECPTLEGGCCGCYAQLHITWVLACPVGPRKIMLQPTARQGDYQTADTCLSAPTISVSAV